MNHILTREEKMLLAFFISFVVQDGVATEEVMRLAGRLFCVQFDANAMSRENMKRMLAEPDDNRGEVVS